MCILQVGAAVQSLRASGSASAESFVQGRSGQRSGHRNRSDHHSAIINVPHGNHPLAHAQEAAQEKVRLS